MVQQKKALIIDQSPIFSHTLKEVIQMSAPHVIVTEVHNTDQALGILMNQSPDVVFLDIAFPRGNGIEFIGNIKGMLPDTRIVVLTSHDSREHREASIQQGADEFLSKEHSVGLRLLDIIHATLHRQPTA